MTARADRARVAAGGWAAVALLVGACACSRSPRDAAPRERPPASRPAASVPAPAASPTAPAPTAPAVDAGADPACVAACVKSRQMVAMSIEAIEAECVRTCAEPPPPALAP